MKFCPYCGADLVDSTVSFCSECGKALPGEQKEEKTEKIVEADKSKSGSDEQKSRKKKKKPPKKRKAKAKADAEPTETKDDGYDGYYDDIRPVDEGRQREGMDKALVKNVVLIIAGVLFVVVACVAVMYML